MHTTPGAATVPRTRPALSTPSTHTAPATRSDLSLSPAAALAFFGRRLQFETDASDVYAGQITGEPVIIVDVRGAEAFAQGHVQGAVHMPYRDIPARAPQELATGADIVVYCWGPGCNAGVKAGFALAQAGLAAKEMIGGYEYWAREGYPITDGTGTHRRTPDPLSGVVGAAAPSCRC